MDKKIIYDKYLEAIIASDLTLLTTLAANLSSVNLQNLDVSANWDSSVKEAVDSKINDLKTKISIITSEQTNLNNIVSKSKELKTKIESYNKVYSNIRNLSRPVLQNNATEEQKVEYNNKVREYNKNEQYKTELNNLVSEIEVLISFIKSINFGSTATTSGETSPDTISTSSNNENAHIKAEEILALKDVNAYNSYWSNNLEKPISNKLTILEMSNQQTESSIEISKSIIENSDSELAKNLAQIALTKEGGLYQMQASNLEQVDQYQKLYDIYKGSNHNGNNNDSNNMDGELRLIAYRKLQELNAKKPPTVQPGTRSTTDLDEIAKQTQSYIDYENTAETIGAKYDAETIATIEKINSEIDGLDLSVNNNLLNPYALNPQQVGIFEGSEVFSEPSKESRETVAYSLFAQAIHAKETPGAFPVVGTNLTEIKSSDGNLMGYTLSSFNGPNGYEVYNLYLPEGESGTYRVELDPKQ